MNMLIGYLAVYSLTIATILAVVFITAHGLTGGIGSQVCPDATVGAYLRCLESIYNPKGGTP